MALNPVIAYVMKPTMPEYFSVNKRVMEKADDGSSFQSSELGTVEYWEDSYKREIKAFQDMGDIGEVWFGEESQARMVKWLEKNETISFQDAVLDMGCGNGAFLLEMRRRGFTCLAGVDYARGAIDLARTVLAKEGYEDVELQTCDLTRELASLPTASCLHRHYHVCVDKGTYDAISLNPEEAEKKRLAYKHTVKHLLLPQGMFMITSCNWTKDELLAFFETDFRLHGEIKAPSFQFGGKVGQCITTLIFTPL